MNLPDKLSETAIQMMVWKSPKLLNCCLLIAQHSLDLYHFWPDDVDFNLDDQNKNLSGISWKLAIQTLKIVEKTGRFKSSTSEGSKGRTIFEYRSINPHLARAFLKRHGQQVPREQGELSLV